MTNRQKWINALRSGEYQQGTQSLRINNDFCCLGVACDIYHKETGEGGWYKYENCNSFNFKSATCSRSSVLTFEVMKWLGFISSNPIIMNNTLTYYNDCNGFSFLEIADMIEEEFLKEDVNV